MSALAPYLPCLVALHPHDLEPLRHHPRAQPPSQSFLTLPRLPAAHIRLWRRQATRQRARSARIIDRRFPPQIDRMRLLADVARRLGTPVYSIYPDLVYSRLNQGSPHRRSRLPSYHTTSTLDLLTAPGPTWTMLKES